MKKLLLIVNPLSGTLTARKKLLDVIKIFCEAGCSVEVRTTLKRGDATEFVKAHGKVFDSIVVLGGDGTLNEVITGSAGIDFHGEYGFVPCGTTNDLAASIGIPKEPEKAAKAFVDLDAKPFDIGKFCGERFFSYIASFGAFTETSYATDQKMKNVLGHFAYVAEGINSLSKIKSYRLNITVDDKEFDGEFIFGAVANSLSVGGIMKLDPSSVDFSDGMHEILLVKKPKNAVHFAQIFNSAIAGNFDDADGIIFTHGKKIAVNSEEALDWCVDGEFAGSVKTAEIENISGKFMLVRP